MNPHDHERFAFELKKLAADLVRKELEIEQGGFVNFRDLYVKTMMLSERDPHYTDSLKTLAQLLMAEINRRDKLEFDDAMKQKDWEDSAHFEPVGES